MRLDAFAWERLQSTWEMDGYLRIGFGSDPAHLAGALDRVGDLLDRLPDAR